MTVFIWMDENGEWRVTHLPPEDESTFLRVITTGLDGTMFMTAEGEEVEVKIR